MERGVAASAQAGGISWQRRGSFWGGGANPAARTSGAGLGARPPSSRPPPRPGAQAHTPSWGSEWSLPGGWPCCSNKAGGAAAWGEQMPLAASGTPASRAQPRGRREGGEREASRSWSTSSSRSRRRAPGRSRSRCRSCDGRGRGETVCECWGLACCSSGAGWSLLWGGCGGDHRGAGRGLGPAAAAVGVCTHLGACLGSG